MFVRTLMYRDTWGFFLTDLTEGKWFSEKQWFNFVNWKGRNKRVSKYIQCIHVTSPSCYFWLTGQHNFPTQLALHV